ncbi:MAG: sporulation protein [Dehalococcoidia bacterium]|nr:sporulation protein [Dehalococcoidia bacterium]
MPGLKETFNVSGTQITIASDHESYAQADRVSGRVLARGGDYPQSGKSIELELKEFWTESHKAGKYGSTRVTVFKVRDAVTLVPGFSIQPHEEQLYPFEVQLPVNGRVSTQSTGWRLVVTIDIAGALDPHGELILSVQPAEESLAIVAACEAGLKFEEDPRFRTWQLRTGQLRDGAMRFRLHPPAVLKSELDYLELTLLQGEDGAVTGSALFDFQEGSLVDYFKSIVNRHEVRRPLTLSRDEIYLPDGETNEETIRDLIGGMLQDVVGERQQGPSPATS